MRPASFILSVVLHATLILALFFWPSSPRIKLDAPPVLISLVDAAPGGNKVPTVIQGAQGQRADSGKLAPSMPAPPKPEATPAVPDPVPAIAQPKEEPKKPEPKVQPKEPDVPVIAEKKEPPKKEPPKKEEPKEEPKKPEPPKKKEEPKKDDKKPEPKKDDKKPDPKKDDKKPAVDPVKEALKKASAAASRENTPNKGSAVERAMAEAKRNARGFGGGGGGEGEGEGGGGLHDVYMGQVMMAVRANWQMNTGRRDNLICAVRVRVDAGGNVLEARLEESSGNAQFDGTAVNAVVRTGSLRQFPTPPNPDYQDLLLTFNLNDMMGR